MIDAVKNLKGNGSGDEVEINVTIMWIFASINLVLDFVNIALFLVKKDEDGTWRVQCCRCCKKDGGDDYQEENLNMMSALAHVAADTLRSVAVMVAGLYAQFSPADDSDKADAIAAIIVSVAIAGSVFPLLSSVCWKLLELWGGDDYARVATDTPTIEQQLLDYNHVFDSSDDDEEIVPWRESSTFSSGGNFKPVLDPSTSQIPSEAVANPLFDRT